MYKYFVSYIGIKQNLFSRTMLAGNSFLDTNVRFCEEMIRKFEEQEAKKCKVDSIIVISVKELPAEEVQEC